jgi:hypothetical protein
MAALRPYHTSTSPENFQLSFSFLVLTRTVFEPIPVEQYGLGVATAQDNFRCRGFLRWFRFTEVVKYRDLYGEL